MRRGSVDRHKQGYRIISPIRETCDTWRGSEECVLEGTLCSISVAGFAPV